MAPPGVVQDELSQRDMEAVSEAFHLTCRESFRLPLSKAVCAVHSRFFRRFPWHSPRLPLTAALEGSWILEPPKGREGRYRGDSDTGSQGLISRLSGSCLSGSLHMCANVCVLLPSVLREIQ